MIRFRIQPHYPYSMLSTPCPILEMLIARLGSGTVKTIKVIGLILIQPGFEPSTFHTWEACNLTVLHLLSVLYLIDVCLVMRTKSSLSLL